jgi:DNA polymerase
VELRGAGVYKYAEHPSTDVWCVAYAFDEGPVKVWRIGQPMPNDLSAAARNGTTYFKAWNAAFERIIWREIMVKRHGWPAIKDDRFVCAMVVAAAAGLPKSLEEAAIVLGLQEQKDMAGSRLMMQMAKPRRIEDDGTIVWWDDPDKLDRLVAYCAQDVIVEREIWKRLPPAMDRRERAIYLLDQRINDRGVLLDATLIQAGKKVADRATKLLTKELSTLTHGTVSTPNKVEDLKRWIAMRVPGIDTTCLDKEAIGELLDLDLPDDVRRALELRAEAAKASVRKLASMEKVASAKDGKARGLLQYYGAGTGRWAGRLIQPQNFPRGSVTIDEDVIAAIKSCDLSSVDASPLEVVSSALRGCIVADPGSALYVADFAAIEARVIAWLAGQEDLLALFASGGKVYETMAAVIFGIPVEAVTKEQRQLGKMAVLGCGFQMGAKRFAEQAKVDLELAMQAVDAYRTQNGRIKALWWAMQDTAIRVVSRGATAPVAVPGTGGKLHFRIVGNWLAMGLPSGRSLWYYAPRIVMKPVPWSEELVPAVQIDAMNGYTRKWEPATMYGGLWAENATQAVARDLMADGMMRLEAAGYPVLLTVHDEVIAQAEPGHAVGDFVSTLAAVPEWAAGCPVAAEGWSGIRYRKG